MPRSSGLSSRADAPWIHASSSAPRAIARGLGHAEHWSSALAMPLFARTAPELELGYDTESTSEGRLHKEATSTEAILSDVQASIDWLRQELEADDRPLRITVVGFCFGGHAALLAATLADVKVSLDFYGAGMSRGRPGGGAPSLELLPSVHGELHCLCGSLASLIPSSDQQAIQAALQAEDPTGLRLRYSAFEGADHGLHVRSP